MYREFEGFIEKVGEIRFIELQKRQINTFNNLVRKEGNITRGSPHTNSPQADRQAGVAFQEVSAVPSWEGLSQEGSNSQVVNNLASSQAGSQAGNGTPSREGLSQEGSNSQVVNNLALSQAGS